MNCKHRMAWTLLAGLAAGSLLATANLARAAGHGGGGGHGGGAGHMGAFHGGGGFHHGGFGRGFYGGYPYYGFGLGLGLGYGLGYGYGYGYGYGPYGYNYGPYGYAGYGYGYPGYGIPYGSPYPPAYYPNTPSVIPPANGTNPPATPPAPSGTAPTPVMLPPLPIQHLDTEVTLIVRIPAEAILWVNGSKTTQTGSRRQFTSRGLEPGRTYTFHLRAQWTDPNGAAMDHDRSITVQAGERRAIDFAALPAIPGDVVTAPVLPLPGTPTMAVPRANP